MQQTPSWEANTSLASQKISPSYGTRRFFTAFTRARHLSLSWARSMQFVSPTYFLMIHFNIVLPSTSGSYKPFFPWVSPPKPCIHLSSPRTCYIFNQIYSSLLRHSISGEDYPSQVSTPFSLLHPPVYSSLIGPNIFLWTLFSDYIPPSLWETKFHTHIQNKQNHSLAFFF